MAPDEHLSLFGKSVDETPASPLADRMRPRTLNEFVGQDEMVGEGTVLRRMIERDRIVSMILWGPPGTGKTTLASVLANHLNARFIALSAVTSGLKDVKEVVQQAEIHRRGGVSTILFIDEIHRFNKAQQDAFLPHVENGRITLIGATTENPSFDVNSALLSRCRVFVLKQLDEEALQSIIRRAISDPERGLGETGMNVDDDAISFLAARADGDARRALNALEATANSLGDDAADRHVTRELIASALQQATYDYDKSGEGHYNLISALHKSVRSSDPQATIYWLARMLDAGETPLYITRRLVRMAVEDIGLADPRALTVALDAHNTYHMLGSPEGELALAHAAVYLATAPKSNAVYTGFSAALADAREHGSRPVPMHLRNAPTGLMKGLGYGKEYRYDHDEEEGYSGQQCLPDELDGTEYYRPTGHGYEKTIGDRMDWLQSVREQRRTRDDTDA
jgi:putative ATPase